MRTRLAISQAVHQIDSTCGDSTGFFVTFWRIHGLRFGSRTCDFGSRNLENQGVLAEICDSTIAEVQVSLIPKELELPSDSIPRVVRQWKGPSGTIIRSLEAVESPTGVHWILRNFGSLIAKISQYGESVELFPPVSLDPSYSAATIAGPVSSFVRWLRGMPSLHASSVVVDGKVLAVAGQSGAGKSTTIAALAHAGFPLLTDDVLGWRETPDSIQISPGQVPIKLWPATLLALGFNPDSFPRVRPGSEKRIVAMPFHPGNAELELGAIYLLETDSDLRPGEIRPVTGSAAFQALRVHCRDASILPPHLWQLQFQSIAGLASRIPVRRVGAHSGLDRLPEFARTLVDDFRRVSATQKSAGS